MTSGMRKAIAVAPTKYLAKRKPGKFHASPSSPASGTPFESSGTGSVYQRQIAPCCMEHCTSAIFTVRS
ncbi:MAG TPA: hypothetical protein DEF79_03905 [Gammaproteobacteria bacterium]|nr:hypothetical protein [Gammaproteobacteria bacterium]